MPVKLGVRCGACGSGVMTPHLVGRVFDRQSIPYVESVYCNHCNRVFFSGLEGRPVLYACRVLAESKGKTLPENSKQSHCSDHPEVDAIVTKVGITMHYHCPRCLCALNRI